MQVLAKTILYSVLVGLILGTGAVHATVSGNTAGACACDANIDQSEPSKTNPRPVDFTDIGTITECANGDCTNCISDCDVNCDGTTDFIDVGAAVCHFIAGTGSGGGCCNEPDGACTNASQSGFPTCFFTLEAACDFFGGTYHGDNTICVGDDPLDVPAVSTWGLVVLMLSLATAATIVIGRQRRGRTG